MVVIAIGELRELSLERGSSAGKSCTCAVSVREPYVSRATIYTSGFASYISRAQNPCLTQAVAYVICGLCKT